jgi:hypothetical protein
MIQGRDLTIMLLLKKMMTTMKMSQSAVGIVAGNVKTRIIGTKTKKMP